MYFVCFCSLLLFVVVSGWVALLLCCVVCVLNRFVCVFSCLVGCDCACLNLFVFPSFSFVCVFVVVRLCV